MQKRHQPKHIYLNDYLYFLTAHTYLNQYQMKGEFEKKKIMNKIEDFFQVFNFKLYAWVVLDNHYHILFKTAKGLDLPKAMGKIHGVFSYEMNKTENQPRRKIWQNYWDWCIRSEKDFWTHFNYIHHNPIKHKYVQKMENYNFSSFNHWVNKKGMGWVMSIFEQYPIVDFTIDHDDFMDDQY